MDGLKIDCQIIPETFALSMGFINNKVALTAESLQELKIGYATDCLGRDVRT